MKKFALIVSLFFCELPAKTDAKAQEARVKYFGVATVMGGFATYYCHQKWLSSPEYLAFEEMKKNFKDAGMILKVKKNVLWCWDTIITTTNTRYRTLKNMSSVEFYDWIDRYEEAEEDVNNSWKFAEGCTIIATICSWYFIFLSALIEAEQ